ncbi:MAG: serine phosphatase RsbU, partial [Acidobacteria bacterium OLB17]
MRFLFEQEVDGEIREIALEKDHTTFGRASDVDLQLDDQGLSRLNSTVRIEGGSVLIFDNGSTNGTFVNGRPAEYDGTILEDGDTVKMGSSTVLVFKKVADEKPLEADGVEAAAAPTAEAAPAAPPAAAPPAAAAPAPSPLNFLPLAIIVGAIFVIGISAAVIAMTAFSGNSEVASTNPYTGGPTSNGDGDPGGSSSTTTSDAPTNSGTTTPG